MRIWLFAIVLVLWGNLLHPLIGSTAILPGGSWPFVVAGAALVVVSLFAARALGLDAATLGLRPAGAFRGFLIGAFAGAFVATSAVAIMRGIVPALIGQPVIYEPLSRVAAGDLSTHIAFFLPFGAVIPEEFAFRGTLLGGLIARYGVRTAVLASAIAFALWHGTVAFFTVMNTTMSWRSAPSHTSADLPRSSTSSSLMRPRSGGTFYRRGRAAPATTPSFPASSA